MPRHMRNPLAKTVHVPKGDFVWDFRDPLPWSPNGYKRQKVCFFLYPGCKVFLAAREKDVGVELKPAGEGPRKGPWRK